MLNQFAACNSGRIRDTPDTLLEFAKRVCNKPCGMYFSQASQQYDRNTNRKYVPRVFNESIWQEWMRCEAGGKAGIEYDRFFARSVRGEEGEDSSINGIVDSHIFVANGTLDAMGFLRGLEVGQQLRYHHVHPLFHALVVIADNLERMHPQPEDPERFSLHRWAKRQTVLLVRTGREGMISAPISFESLRAVEQPLGREDRLGNFREVIRIPLAAAVQFVAQLEAREDRATGMVWNPIAGHDTSLNPRVTVNTTYGHQVHTVIPGTARMWADVVLSNAYEIGFHISPQVVSSRARVEALIDRGGNGTQEEHLPFDPEYVL
ncbi:MAG: hypothetical protein Q9174_004146 [Haloplaca sp. 1 TL-2023]